MIDFSDPRLILSDLAPPKQGRICRTCHGNGEVYGEDSYAMVCHGPCKGTGYTDLPLPDLSEVSIGQITRGD